MREVISRRYKRLAQECEGFNEAPDLIVIDGGQGAVKQRVRDFKRAGAGSSSYRPGQENGRSFYARAESAAGIGA